MQEEASGLREAIEAAYARFLAAVANRDLDGVRDIHASTFTEVETDGEEHGLSRVMAEWNEVFGDETDWTYQVLVETCTRDGAAALVSASSTWAYVVVDGSVRYNIRIESILRDSWIDTQSGWCRCRSDISSAKTWVNGRLHSEDSLEPPPSADAWASIARDLGLQALPFKTVHAGSGFDDLAFLDGMIGDARIVALGEASHGTAEHFQMKHRTLEYLVETKGFTVLAMEVPWSGSQLADRFIKSGDGDAAAALAALHSWTWQTEEMRAVLERMRALNSTRGERPELSFAGFGMQAVNSALKQVLALCDRMESSDRDRIRRLYEGFERLEPGGPALEVSASEKVRLRDNAAEALELIDARRELLLQRVTPDEYLDARQAARNLLQASEMLAGNPLTERTRALADNVAWLLEDRFPGQRVVLWAHNGHVGAEPILGAKSLGMHLRDRYGEGMIVLGFASHHGEVRAKRIAQGKFMPGPPVALPLRPAKKDSVETLFHDAGFQRGILEFRRVRADSALGTWLSRPRLHRWIGTGFDPDHPSGDFRRCKLPELYDGIVFIAESTATRPLLVG